VVVRGLRAAPTPRPAGRAAAPRLSPAVTRRSRAGQYLHRLLPARLPGTQPIQLYKNNTDGKGASYGSHENYLMSRQTPFP